MTALAVVLGGMVGFLVPVAVYALTGSVVLMAVSLPFGWVAAFAVGFGIGVLGAAWR